MGIAGAIGTLLFLILLIIIIKCVICSKCCQFNANNNDFESQFDKNENDQFINANNTRNTSVTPDSLYLGNNQTLAAFFQTVGNNQITKATAPKNFIHNNVWSKNPLQANNPNDMNTLPNKVGYTLSVNNNNNNLRNNNNQNKVVDARNDFEYTKCDVANGNLVKVGGFGDNRFTTVVQTGQNNNNQSQFLLTSGIGSALDTSISPSGHSGHSHNTNNNNNSSIPSLPSQGPATTTTNNTAANYMQADPTNIPQKMEKVSHNILNINNNGCQDITLVGGVGASCGVLSSSGYKSSRHSSNGNTSNNSENHFRPIHPAAANNNRNQMTSLDSAEEEDESTGNSQVYC